MGAETLYIPTQAKVGLEWATEIEWASQIEWAAFQLRLAEKQVNVLGHDHVAEDAELEIAMYTLQRSFESAPACVVSDGRRW